MSAEIHHEPQGAVSVPAVNAEFAIDSLIAEAEDLQRPGAEGQSGYERRLQALKTGMIEIIRAFDLEQRDVSAWSDLFELFLAVHPLNGFDTTALQGSFRGNPQAIKVISVLAAAAASVEDQGILDRASEGTEEERHLFALVRQITAKYLKGAEVTPKIIH